MVKPQPIDIHSFRNLNLVCEPEQCPETGTNHLTPIIIQKQ